eukprot:TRINITY_DN8464_c0_g1_i2.p1 TRINITY_DN8464_c0_g1~~TRINITY_DN8464_c0_g1_i2.p1  ORF type:complete len:101 (-),score=4.38 TRINITY_DN8464_c0_g1_i2:12-314(-)
MWAVPLECEVIMSIDLTTGDVSCTKCTEPNTQYLILIHKLRPIPTFTTSLDIMDAYLIMLGRNKSYDEIPIPTITKVSVSCIYYCYTNVIETITDSRTLR